jgi:5-methylcytosine-specific restriction endonuclease McrA
VSESSRRYREENYQKVRVRERRYKEKNRERVRESDRRYQKENLTKARERKRRWRKENLQRARETRRRANQARRARKKNPNYPNDRLSRGLKGKLMKLQNGKCAYANAPLAHWCAIDIRKENHMDHIMPLALDGRNIDSNMQLTCPACNLHKNDSHPDDFARRVGLIV